MQRMVPESADKDKFILQNQYWIIVQLSIFHISSSFISKHSPLWPPVLPYYTTTA